MYISSNITPTENLVNPLNFTDFFSLQDLATNKSYTPISTFVLEHILTTINLCNLERLFYLLADSVSLIRHNKGHQRNITFSAKQWAKKLNCSVAEVFLIQQSLEEKGYFNISRSRNKGGKNMKNVITPTLPDSVFMFLANTPNKFNIDTSSASNLTASTYIPSLEGKRAYLDRTKMFIKLNYDLLSRVASYQHLAKYSKVMWLDLYATGYRYYLKHRDGGKNATNLNNPDILNASDGTNYHGSYSLTTTYQELQDKYSCSKSVISKTLKELETLGFITRKRFFVKNDDDEDDNLHDKSIWRITVTLPNTMQQQLMEVENRVQQAEGRVVSNSDPYVSNSCQYINKYFKLNIKDLDSIDSGKNSFEKIDNFLPETPSKLSEFYKNSLEEKQDNLSDITLSQIFEVETFYTVEESTKEGGEEGRKGVEKQNLPIVQDVPTVIEALDDQGMEIALSDNLVGLSNKVEIYNTETITNAEALHSCNTFVTTKLEGSRLTQDKPLTQVDAKLLTHNKPKAQDKTSSKAKSLKSFYPLSKEQVDKINRLSDREFSNNFANQLLLKLYCRDPNKTFMSHNHMISYMSKAFSYELHQGPSVNHESFRFTVNVSDPESVEMRQREKYLAEVEYSIDTSYASQLRRKIAAMFEPELAYRLLTEVEYKFEYQGEVEVVDDQQLIKEALCIIKLPEDLTLTDGKHDILDKAVMSVYGNIDISYEKIATNSWGISKKSQVSSETNMEGLDLNSTWYKIRKQLIDEFGENVDKAWFSKLVAEENKDTKTLTIIAPTPFMRDYVKNKFGCTISRIARGIGDPIINWSSKS